MVEADKKSKNELKVKIITESDELVNKIVTSEKRIAYLTETVEVMRKRLTALEEHLRSLDHGNEQGNDIRDGGWFD